MVNAGEPTAVLRAALDQSNVEAGRGNRPPSRRVQGRPDQVWSVVSRLRAQARHEYVSLDDPTYLVRSGVSDRIIDLGPQTMRSMITRGVAVRQITTHGGLRLDERETILWSRGSQARVVDRLPFKAGVLDRSVALVPMDLSVFANGFLVILDPVVVQLVLTLQHQLWSAGEPVAAAADGPPEDLQRLVAALASGQGDAAAAASIGMSPRTYSRRVAQLMDLLGATNRFQVGAEAVRRGWL